MNYPTEWKVTSNSIGGRRIYMIWRQTREQRQGEPMHSGLRENAEGCFDTEEAAQKFADELNRKE